MVVLGAGLPIAIFLRPVRQRRCTEGRDELYGARWIRVSLAEREVLRPFQRLDVPPVVRLAVIWLAQGAIRRDSRRQHDLIPRPCNLDFHSAGWRDAPRCAPRPGRVHDVRAAHNRPELDRADRDGGEPPKLLKHDLRDRVGITEVRDEWVVVPAGPLVVMAPREAVCGEELDIGQLCHPSGSFSTRSHARATATSRVQRRWLSSMPERVGYANEENSYA